MVLVHNYPNQQLRARASSSSWGGSPTSFLTRNTCFVCDVRTCIVFTTKVVPVPSLQLSAVVQPLMLLQMVNEVALVQPLGQL